MIAVLDRFGLQGMRMDRVRGVFLASSHGPSGGPGKVGAVGVAVARGMAFHGLSLNVAVDPEWFRLVIPCGLKEFDATSMHLHLPAAPDPGEVADALARKLRTLYGETLEVRSDRLEQGM